MSHMLNVTTPSPLRGEDFLGGTTHPNGSISIRDLDGNLLCLVRMNLDHHGRSWYGLGRGLVVRSGKAIDALIELPGVPAFTVPVVAFPMLDAIVLDTDYLSLTGYVIIDRFQFER